MSALFLLLGLAFTSHAADSSCEQMIADVFINTAKFKLPVKVESSDHLRKELGYFEQRLKDRSSMRETFIRLLSDESLSARARREVEKEANDNEEMIVMVKGWIKEKAAAVAKIEEASRYDADGAIKEARLETGTKLEKTPELAAYMQDYINYQALDSLPKQSVVSVLVGSPGRIPGMDEMEMARRMVRELTNKGYLVLLDGHSAATPQLMAVAHNGRALALASKPVAGLPADRTVIITNRYLLMEAFTNRYKAYSSFSSVMGVSLALYDKLDSFFGNPRGDFEVLKKWRNRLVDKGWMLGLKFYTRLDIMGLEDVDSLLDSSFRMPEIKKPAEFKPRTYADLSIADLKRAGDYANRMYAGARETQGPAAVIFGSSSMQEKASPLIYSVAYELGKFRMGVATGGSGGAMLAGNMGAFDAGGESLGIPMDGSKALSSEKKTYSEVQTSTFGAQDYAERVPWLLNGRKLIVNAPGGSGTIREIILSLISVSQEPNAVIVFLNSEYYQAVVDWLKTLPGFDPELLARIALVDSKKDLHAAMKQFAADGRIDLSKYKPGKPRSERKRLPEELYKPKKWESSYSDDSSWDY